MPRLGQVQCIEPGERGAAAIGDPGERRAQARGIGDACDLRFVAGESDQIDRFRPELFDQRDQRRHLILAAVVAVGEGAVPVDPQPPAAMGGSAGGFAAIGNHEEFASTGVAHQRQRALKRAAAHCHPARQWLALPRSSGSPARSFLAQRDILARKAHRRLLGIALDAEAQCIASDLARACQRQVEALGGIEWRDEAHPDAAGMFGGDRIDPGREHVLRADFGQPRIDPAPHLILIDVARLGLFEQLPRNHLAFDIECIAGDDRLVRQRQPQPRLVLIRILRSRDQQLERDRSGARNHSHIGLEFPDIEPRGSCGVVAVLDPALGPGQHRVNPPRIVLRRGHRGEQREQPRQRQTGRSHHPHRKPPTPRSASCGSLP